MTSPGLEPKSLQPVRQKKDNPATGGARVIPGRCFNCGMTGHMARACPYQKKKQDDEAWGRQECTMSALTTSKAEARKRVEDLRKQLREVESKMMIDDMSEALFGDQDSTGVALGPSLFVEVCVNGIPAKSLVDTCYYCFSRVRHGSHGIREEAK